MNYIGNIKYWEKDIDVEKCRICSTNFKLTLRKHHCRSCGIIVCKNCLLECTPLNKKDKMKICLKCEKKFNIYDTSKEIEIQTDISFKEINIFEKEIYYKIKFSEIYFKFKDFYQKKSFLNILIKNKIIDCNNNLKNKNDYINNLNSNLELKILNFEKENKNIKDEKNNLLKEIEFLRKNISDFEMKFNKINEDNQLIEKEYKLILKEKIELEKKNIKTQKEINNIKNQDINKLKITEEIYNPYEISNVKKKSENDKTEVYFEEKNILESTKESVLRKKREKKEFEEKKYLIEFNDAREQYYNKTKNIKKGDFFELSK